MLNLTQGDLSGGYRKYLCQVAPRLRAHPGVADLIVAVPPRYGSLLDPALRVVAWPTSDPWLGFPKLARTVREWDPDVVFVPTARWLSTGAPTAVMVRNMEPFVRQPAGSVARGLRRRLVAHSARRAARRADRILAVSEFVADHVRSAWGIAGDCVDVVYHGVDRLLACLEPGAVPVVLSGTRFVLAAGSLLPYRGLEDAVGALAQLDRQEETDLLLAVAGSGDSDYRSRIDTLAQQLGVAERVRWLGELSSSSLAWAYESAQAFLMTSRVEACPNTALEAMAQGAVCISSDCPPMPEIFESAAWYYPAGDVQTMASLLRQALALDAEARARARTTAHRRAAQFTWKATVDRTVEQLARTRAARPKPPVIQ